MSRGCTSTSGYAHIHVPTRRGATCFWPPFWLPRRSSTFRGAHGRPSLSFTLLKTGKQKCPLLASRCCKVYWSIEATAGVRKESTVWESAQDVNPRLGNYLSCRRSQPDKFVPLPPRLSTLQNKNHNVEIQFDIFDTTNAMAHWLKNDQSRVALVLLVWAVLFTVSTAKDTAEIVPLTYLSGNITFNAWIDLITLSLAPLLAHLAGGAPRTTLIDDSIPKPRWHDRMCHYNPTSVLWRYYAIADRRLRSTKWTETWLQRMRCFGQSPGGMGRRWPRGRVSGTSNAFRDATR